MDTNHALRILAHGILTDARNQGTYFCGPHSGKVYLSTIPGVDLTDPLCVEMLEDLRKAGLLSFSRCDLVAAADPDLVQASTWVSKLGLGLTTELHFLNVA